MDDIFAEISGMMEPGQLDEQVIPVTESEGQALESLAEALTSAGSLPVMPPQAVAHLLEGLKAVRELATMSSRAELPVGEWTCSFSPALQGDKRLFLRYPGPPKLEMGFQVEHGGNLYGGFYLNEEMPEGEQTVFFYLEQALPGWILHGNLDSPFTVALPPLAEGLPWNPNYVMPYQEDLSLPATGASLLSIFAGLVPAMDRAAAAGPAPTQDRAGGADLAASSQAATLLQKPGGLVLIQLPGRQRLPVLGPMSIGRDPENKICLDDKETSRRHALIEPAGQGWQIKDLGSSNGTWVNGSRISLPTELHPGDVLLIGRTSLQVARGEPAASPKP